MKTALIVVGGMIMGMSSLWAETNMTTNNPVRRPDSASVSNTIVIVGFGDSITRAKTRMPDAGKRWLNRLEQMLAAEFPAASFRVINSGGSGNSAREAMQRFEKDVLAHNPDFVLLQFGGNNSDPVKPERRVSLEEFTGILEDFRQRLPRNTQVIVITFPPLLDDQLAFRDHPYVKAQGGPDAMVGRYRDVTRQFAAQHGFPLVDLDRELKARMAQTEKNHFTLDDGGHLTEAGNQALAEMVFAALKIAVSKSQNAGGK